MSEAALDHALLRDLVAALSDGELPVGEARVVHDHVRTCAPCQRELAIQRSLALALARQPAQLASARLRSTVERIGMRGPRPFRAGWRTWAAPAAAAALVAMGIVGAAAVVSVGVGEAGALIARRGASRRPVSEIPLLRDALTDCRRAMARNFPRRADLPAVSAGLRFPVGVLGRGDAELFSTWRTTLAGAPAAALAYRWRGIVVVQYAVSAELIRQQPELDAVLREAALYSGSEGGQGIVASVANGRGTLLLGDAPPEVLRRLIL